MSGATSASVASEMAVGAEPRDRGASGARCNSLRPPRITPLIMPTVHSWVCTPRFGVPSGGACQEDGQLSEEAEAVRSRCGSKLTMIEEVDETCEETCPPSGEHGGAPCLQEDPSEGEPRSAHGGPTLCAPAPRTRVSDAKIDAFWSCAGLLVCYRTLA